jgi:RNA polymerase sigma-70 factor, ECF subfamily
VDEAPVRAEIEHSLKQNWSRLFSYALRLCGDREAASDLLQSCALKALGSAALPRDGAAIRAWLFRVMHNAWIDQYRRAALSEADHPAEEIAADGWRYDERLVAEITVRQAMNQLAPEQREIIELVDLAGFRYAEVAEILAIPVGTVMSRLSRARLALLAAVERGNVTPLRSGRRHAR